MSRQFLYLSSAQAQMSLGFGDARPTERLFFALLPPADIAAAAHALGAGLCAGRPQARCLAAGRLHVTLHYLGEYAGMPPSLPARASRAAESLAVAPTRVCFDRIGSFGGQRRERPGVLLGQGDGIAGVVALQRRLGEALVRQGLPADARFTPHMTLLYDHDALPEQAVAPLAWQAVDVCLLRSVRGEAAYREEGRWPLRP